MFEVGSLVEVKYNGDMKKEHGIARVVKRSDEDVFTVKFAVSGRNRRDVPHSLLTAYDSLSPTKKRERPSISYGDDSDDGGRPAKQQVALQRTQDKSATKTVRPRSSNGTCAAAEGRIATTTTAATTTSSTTTSTTTSSSKNKNKLGKQPKRRLSVQQLNNRRKELDKQQRQQLRDALNLASLRIKATSPNYWPDYEGSCGLARPPQGGGDEDAQDTSDSLFCFLGGACLTSQRGRKSADKKVQRDVLPTTIYATAHSVFSAASAASAGMSVSEPLARGGPAAAADTDAHTDMWACKHCATHNLKLVLRHGAWQERKKCLCCLKNKAVAVIDECAEVAAPVVPETRDVGSSSSSSSSAPPRMLLSSQGGALCETLMHLFRLIRDPPRAITTTSLSPRSSASMSLALGSPEARFEDDMRLACNQRGAGAVASLRFTLDACGCVSARLVDFLLLEAAQLAYEQLLAGGARSSGKTGDNNADADSDSESGSESGSESDSNSDSDDEEKVPAIAALCAVTQSLKYITHYLASTEGPVGCVIPQFKPSFVGVACLLDAMVEAERRADAGGGVARGAKGEDRGGNRGAATMEDCLREARAVALGLLACALDKDRSEGGSAILAAMLAQEASAGGSPGEVLECLLVYASLLARRVVLLVRETNCREGGTIVPTHPDGQGRSRVGPSAALRASEQLYLALRSIMQIADIINTSTCAGGPLLGAGNEVQSLVKALAPTAPLLATLTLTLTPPTAPLLATLHPADSTAASSSLTPKAHHATACALLEGLPQMPGRSLPPAGLKGDARVSAITRRNMLARLDLTKAHSAGAVRRPQAEGEEVSPVVAMMAFLSE